MSKKMSTEGVVEYVRRNIIAPNFEDVEEVEILSTIRYDPNLTHVFPTVSPIDCDIRFDFLKNETVNPVYTSDNKDLLVKSYMQIDGHSNLYNPLQELMHLFDKPAELETPSITVAEPERNLRSVFKDRFFLLKEHQQRLDLALSYFEWDFEIPRSLLLDKLIEALPLPEGQHADTLEQRMELLVNLNQNYKMRVLISKSGNMRIEAHPLPPSPVISSDMQKYFICTLLSGFLDGTDAWDIYVDTKPIVISPFTTFKTTKREHYNQARSRMEELAVAAGTAGNKKEILVYNEAFQLMEGSITSVAIKQYINDKEYRFVTPFLTSGCLCGVMRHFLIQKGLIQEYAIDVRDLKVGDVILIFNGVMGCVKGIIRQTPKFEK
ncbi:HCL299Cp [Eremothecium sinecaudum]|uniref:HCL299Cp n=1 Tax=Eremothecium sinecaudum TaxID=45286 RepID=A0A109UZ67_9SACH|nr:HCL299Cp [Eremothecium sinecaudum]AMD19852.1 HCL299Cp [Eremothecium sinecaudum]